MDGSQDRTWMLSVQSGRIPPFEERRPGRYATSREAERTCGGGSGSGSWSKNGMTLESTTTGLSKTQMRRSAHLGIVPRDADDELYSHSYGS